MSGLPSWSIGLPKAYLGRTCTPWRVTRCTLRAILAASQARSLPELPTPTTTTSLASKTEGSR